MVMLFIKIVCDRLPCRVRELYFLTHTIACSQHCQEGNFAPQLRRMDNFVLQGQTRCLDARKGVLANCDNFVAAQHSLAGNIAAQQCQVASPPRNPQQPSREAFCNITPRSVSLRSLAERPSLQRATAAPPFFLQRPCKACPWLPLNISLCMRLCRACGAGTLVSWCLGIALRQATAAASIKWKQSKENQSVSSTHSGSKGHGCKTT